MKAVMRRKPTRAHTQDGTKVVQAERHVLLVEALLLCCPGDLATATAVKDTHVYTAAASCEHSFFVSRSDCTPLFYFMPRARRRTWTT
jgi:hypothetical protein